MTKIKKSHAIVLLFYEKRSSCSCGCRLLAVTSLAVVFPCCSVLSTAPLRRRVSSLAVSKAFWSWMDLVGSVTAPWFPGACMFLTMWWSLITQHVTTTIKMKQTALSGSVSMNWNKLLKMSPARDKMYFDKNWISYLFINLTCDMHIPRRCVTPTMKRRARKTNWKQNQLCMKAKNYCLLRRGRKSTGDEI